MEEATETDTPLPEIYELLRGFLDDLCRTEPGPQGVLAFELRLLRETGLQPDWRDARLAAGTQKAAAALMGDDRVAARRLKLTAAQTGELGRFLDGFILYHLGRLPRGRTAALAGTP